jgi:hypothetical protein
VTGFTGSSDFPWIAGGADTTFAGSNEAFVARLTADFAASRGLQHTLTLTKAGTGAGTVSGGGLYDEGTLVILSAAADPGPTLFDWSGDADCSDGLVVMDRKKYWIAIFDLLGLQHTLTVTKDGSGSVTSNHPGIHCGSDCVEGYVNNAAIALTAEPEPGSNFSGWGGDCSSCGTSTTCDITMDTDRSCVAGFDRVPGPDLVVTGVSVPAVAQKKERIIVTYWIENQGDQPTTKKAKVLLRLSTDGVIGMDDRALGEVKVPKFPAGAVYDGAKKVRIKKNVTPGDHFVGVMADPLNKIPEINETNNTGFAPITVTD